MAVQRRMFTSMSSLGVLLFEVFLDYEDTDYQTINDDGDPDDFRMIQFEITNHHTKALVVTAQKGNGQNWVSRSIPADGQTYTQAAGGAIKYESDLPRWFWEWGS